MRTSRRTLVLAIPLLTLCALLVFARAGAADAQVVHGAGFEATVAGWTSWYGSYQLAGVGQTWCIDHGLQARQIQGPRRRSWCDIGRDDAGECGGGAHDSRDS